MYYDSARLIDLTVEERAERRERNRERRKKERGKAVHPANWLHWAWPLTLTLGLTAAVRATRKSVLSGNNGLLLPPRKSLTDR